MLDSICMRNMKIVSDLAAQLVDTYLCGCSEKWVVHDYLIVLSVDYVHCRLRALLARNLHEGNATASRPWYQS